MSELTLPTETKRLNDLRQQLEILQLQVLETKNTIELYENMIGEEE